MVWENGGERRLYSLERHLTSLRGSSSHSNWPYRQKLRTLPTPTTSSSAMIPVHLLRILVMLQAPSRLGLPLLSRVILFKVQEAPMKRAQLHRAASRDEDAKHLYSAATSVDPICSRRYIQELSQDLYRNLQTQLSQPDWHSVTQALPDLIKTFASKIGQEGDSQVHLDIMYLCPQASQVSGLPACLQAVPCSLTRATPRARDIVRNLEDLFHDDRLDSTRKEGPESMSLLDKMDLWNRKGAEGGAEADKRLFEGS